MTVIDSAKGVLWDINTANLGLFLDVDGTLLDIADSPDRVHVDPRLRADLAAAATGLNGALALVSGRPISELDALFAPLRLAAGGTHGAELRRRPDDQIVRRVSGKIGDGPWEAVCRLLRGFPGSYAENKEVSFAVHYADPGTDAGRLRTALEDLIERFSLPERRLRLIAGHAVFEVQLEGFDKGSAIEWFMADEPFRGRRPMFIGDDEIDRPAFDTALAMGGLAFSVGTDLPRLSGSLPAPAAVREWLHGFAR